MNDISSMSSAHNMGAKSYERDQVIKIINSVIQKVEHRDDEANRHIFDELMGLQRIIEEARQEIGQTRPDEINKTHIPTATDELDAVVEATAEATGTIMDAAEKIMEHAGIVGGEHGDIITNEVMKIFEACSFQDIIGQRITKVIKTLKDIESKVTRVITIIASKIPGIAEEVDMPLPQKELSEDEKLLNGPQLPGNAISQDEIDKMLADF
mgnify:CR=1 FL=1